MKPPRLRRLIPHPSSLIPPRLQFAPVKKLLGALVCLMALVACGKRGDPKPPVPMIPKETSDLVVTQRGNRTVLAWSYPSLTTSGKQLGPVHRVDVFRYIEPLPVPQTGRDPNAILPGDVDPTVPRPIAEFAKVPGLATTQFNKLKQRIDSIQGANLPAATNGAKLTYEDTPAFHTDDQRPVRLNYAVSTAGTAATSALSNLATIVPLDVPPPPAHFTATAKPEGVVLAWDKVEHAAGYNLYRTPAGESFDELAVPVNAKPVAATTYTDVPPYGNFDYRVTAVASAPAAKTPLIESELSPAAAATFKDLLPPPAPTGLAALVETKAVRLVWDAVDVPDMSGYFVYRTDPQGHRLQLTPTIIPQTTFRDISIEPGTEYTYEVVAIDRAHNVSPPAKTGPVLVPR
jgi:hypothetical protein